MATTSVRPGATGCNRVRPDATGCDRGSPVLVFNFEVKNKFSFEKVSNVAEYDMEIQRNIHSLYNHKYIFVSFCNQPLLLDVQRNFNVIFTSTHTYYNLTATSHPPPPLLHTHFPPPPHIHTEVESDKPCHVACEWWHQIFTHNNIITRLHTVTSVSRDLEMLTQHKR